MRVGFGWMPLYLVRDELSAGTLCEVKYAGGSRFTFTPRLVHRTDRPLGRAGRRLFSLLQDARWPQGTPEPKTGATGKRARRRRPA
jgi:hypothetical protein